MLAYSVYESKKFEDIESPLYERADTNCPDCSAPVRKAVVSVDIVGMSPFVTTGSYTRYSTVTCTWTKYYPSFPTLVDFSCTVNWDPIDGHMTVTHGLMPSGSVIDQPGCPNPDYEWYPDVPFGVNGMYGQSTTDPTGIYYPTSGSYTDGNVTVNRTDTHYDYVYPSVSASCTIDLSNPFDVRDYIKSGLQTLMETASAYLDNIADNKTITFKGYITSGSCQNYPRFVTGSITNVDSNRYGGVYSRISDSQIYFDDQPYCGNSIFTIIRMYAEQVCIMNQPYAPTSTGSAFSADLLTYSGSRIGTNIYSPCGLPTSVDNNGNGSGFVVTTDNYVFINTTIWADRNNALIQDCRYSGSNCTFPSSTTESLCRPITTGSTCTSPCL